MGVDAKATAFIGKPTSQLPLFEDDEDDEIVIDGLYFSFIEEGDFIAENTPAPYTGYWGRYCLVDWDYTITIDELIKDLQELKERFKDYDIFITAELL